MDDEHNWRDPHKIILIGGRGVGKASISFQIIHEHFTFPCQHDFSYMDSYRKDNFMVDGIAHTFEILDFRVGKYSNIVSI